MKLTSHHRKQGGSPVTARRRGHRTTGPGKEASARGGKGPATHSTGSALGLGLRVTRPLLKKLSEVTLATLLAAGDMESRKVPARSQRSGALGWLDRQPLGSQGKSGGCLPFYQSPPATPKQEHPDGECSSESSPVPRILTPLS